MRQFALGAVCLLVLAASSAAFAQSYGAVLTGSQEVPPTTTPGFGNATVTFDATRANVTITISVANLGSPISGFHIHRKSDTGGSGPIVLNIQGLGGTFTNGRLSGTFPIDATTAAGILQNPSNYYVNVHTQQFPGGAIRGDLALASGGTVTYAAELRGSNETPPNSSAAFGSALVTIDPAAATVAFDVVTSGMTPSASHIHNITANNAGPVFIAFGTKAADFTNGRIKGTLSTATLDQTLLNGLLTNPSNYYVNVHSSAFPGGEIRGALVPANEAEIAAAGRVTNGAGTTFVTDARVFNPSFDAPATALLAYFPAGTSPNATAAQALAVNIPPRGTAVLDDIAGAQGLNVSGTTGAIRVSSASTLNVSSRIFADQRASGKGTFGQFVPGVTRADALRRGVLAQLSNSADTAQGARTNLGFFNPNSGLSTVRLELRNGAGSVVATALLTLAALSQQQNAIGIYFPGVDLSNAQNLTLSFDASAPVVAYASVVDNVSTDPFFVVAQPDSGIAANQ